MSLLVVGQAPGRELPAGAPAFWDSDSIRRLAEYAGIGADNWERMYELADFVNLVQDYPGRWADGTDHVKDCFPTKEARAGAERVWDEVNRDVRITHVITLGHRVALMMRTAHIDMFKWHQLSRFHMGKGWGPGLFCTRAPHPSGRNRWWNDADNLAAGQEFWRAALA